MSGNLKIKVYISLVQHQFEPNSYHEYAFKELHNFTEDSPEMANYYHFENGNVSRAKFLSIKTRQFLQPLRTFLKTWQTWKSTIMKIFSRSRTELHIFQRNHFPYISFSKPNLKLLIDTGVVP